jgi:hypothetical protein
MIKFNVSFQVHEFDVSDDIGKHDGCKYVFPGALSEEDRCLAKDVPRPGSYKPLTQWCRWHQGWVEERYKVNF